MTTWLKEKVDLLNFSKFKSKLLPLLKEVQKLSSTDIHSMLNGSEEIKKYNDTVRYLMLLETEGHLKIEHTKYGLSYLLVKGTAGEEVVH